MAYATDKVNLDMDKYYLFKPEKAICHPEVSVLCAPLNSFIMCAL